MFLPMSAFTILDDSFGVKTGPARRQRAMTSNSTCFTVKLDSSLSGSNLAKSRIIGLGAEA
jgi:hypothetical protein